MLQHYWTLITKKSHIDNETNTLIIGEILENVQFTLPKNVQEQFERDVKSKSMILPPFEYEIVSYMGTEKPNEEVIVQAELVLPNGHTLTIGQTSKLSSGKTGRFRHRLRSTGLPICGSGLNKFRVFEVLGGKRRLLAEIPLAVEVNFI